MDKVVVYMTAIQYPCGKGSSCCGPVGQKLEDIILLKNAIDESLKCEAEVADVKERNNIHNPKPVSRLINSLGLGVLPIVTLNDEIISMGTLNKKDILELLLKKVKT